MRFAFNRLPIRLMHRAVDKVDLNVIWPSDDAHQTVLAAAPKVQFKRQDLFLYDKRILDNAEQLDAVFHAVNRAAQPTCVLDLTFVL